MGRGLAAILSVPDREDGEEMRTLAVDLISPNPDQPRRRFEEESLQALADSLRERGVLQPVLVRPAAIAQLLLPVASPDPWSVSRRGERPPAACSPPRAASATPGGTPPSTTAI